MLQQNYVRGMVNYIRLPNLFRIRAFELKDIKMLTDWIHFPAVFGLGNALLVKKHSFNIFIKSKGEQIVSKIINISSTI